MIFKLKKIWLASTFFLMGIYWWMVEGCQTDGSRYRSSINKNGEVSWMRLIILSFFFFFLNYEIPIGILFFIFCIFRARDLIFIPPDRALYDES